jgi:hypothetical protein
VYVWYPTKSFDFRPLKQAKADGDDRYDYYEAKLLDFLVWQDVERCACPNLPAATTAAAAAAAADRATW